MQDRMLVMDQLHQVCKRVQLKGFLFRKKYSEQGTPICPDRRTLKNAQKSVALYLFAVEQEVEFITELASRQLPVTLMN